MCSKKLLTATLGLAGIVSAISTPAIVACNPVPGPSSPDCKNKYQMIKPRKV